VAGYSGRPLVDKLGIKPGIRIAILNAFIHLFVVSRAMLESKIPALLRALTPDGSLWISWPKQASGVQTDITEDVVRAVAFPTGLVDVKVAAIDDVWSGLKLVRRLKTRPT